MIMTGAGAIWGVFLLLIVLVFMTVKCRYGESIYGKPVASQKVSDERTLFQFDHSKMKNCRDMYKHDKDRDTRIAKVREAMNMLDKEAAKYITAGEIMTTGNVGSKPEQALFFLTVANASFINTICETGFNAGHSTYLWLTGNTKAQVYSFDLGNHRYNKPMFELLNKSFPGRLHITWGDSKKTIPAFTKSNPEVKCDLIFVDGGHDYESNSADLKNLRAHANKDHHVIIADDFLLRGINRAWMDGLEAGQLREHFHCFTSGRKLFNMIVGAYIL